MAAMWNAACSTPWRGARRGLVVPLASARIAEAARLGFRRAGVPAAQATETRAPAPGGFEIVALATVREGIRKLLGEKVALRSEAEAPGAAGPGSPAATRASEGAAR